MEDFHIAPETDAEIQRLRKKDRLYIWLCAIILSIILTVVVGLYLNYWPPAARSAGRSVRNTAALSGSATGGHRVVKAGSVGNHGGARCGFGGGSSCCGSPRRVRSGGEQDEGLGRLADMALAKFRAEVGHQPVTAKVIEYNCHFQIDIYSSGNKVIKRYGYQGGALYEIK